MWSCCAILNILRLASCMSSNGSCWLLLEFHVKCYVPKFKWEDFRRRFGGIQISDETTYRPG